MCYTGRCPYETYPQGYNEDCVCVCPKGGECLLDEANESQDGNDEKESQMETLLLEQFVPDTVTNEDRTKYARAMSNWTYLSTYMCINSPDAATLGLLIRIELDSKRREDILDRLVARLTSCIRSQLKHDMAAMYERSKG